MKQIIRLFASLPDDTTETGRAQRRIDDVLSPKTLCAHPASAVQILVL